VPPPVAEQGGWVRLAAVADVPRDGGIAARYGTTEIALFHFASRGEWYATQNRCPHRQQNVLARGILGDAAGKPKVACPLHKNSFDLRNGGCLTGDLPALATFPIKIEDGGVWVELPPARELEAAANLEEGACRSAAPAAERLLAIPQVKRSSPVVVGVEDGHGG